MAMGRWHDDNLLFPTPGRARDILYPNTYRDYRAFPYDPYERRLIRGRDRRDIRDHGGPVERGYNCLREDLLGRSGDLGWSLEYATAWGYRHLLGNQNEVVDIIDNARLIVDGGLNGTEPELLFDGLDKALFGGKLDKMVRLRWKAMPSSAPGNTAVPGIHGSRICIQLNKTPFEDHEGDIDDLLDAMIHEMIHAFFLVCCGAQPMDAKQDGRILDGLHFGVLLYTIKDISRRCKDGPLLLIFYSKDRRPNDIERRERAALLGRGRRRPRPSFITLDTEGTAIGPPPADGQSHCMHENSSITRPQIKNWQVQSYSVAIDYDMDQKGEDIYDLGTNSELLAVKRTEGPPSRSYVELVWSGKRIMIPKEKAMKFASLKKAIEKDTKKELKVPECDFKLLRYLWDFISHRHYYDPEGRPVEEYKNVAYAALPGPPTIIMDAYMRQPTTASAQSQYDDSMLTHIQVFKLGESLRFDELQRYAMIRLYKMQVTYGSPISALGELYNEAGDDKGRPIHADLHRWSRRFLAGGDNSTTYQQYPYSQPGYSNTMRGCNLWNLMTNYRDAFLDLTKKSDAFKEDCEHVQNELVAKGYNGGWASLNSGYYQNTQDYLPAQAYNTPWDSYDSNAVPNSLSWTPLDNDYLAAPPLPGLLDSPDHSTVPLRRRRTWATSGDERLLMPASYLDPDEWYKYPGRDGRMKAKSRITRETVYLS